MLVIGAGTGIVGGTTVARIVGGAIASPGGAVSLGSISGGAISAVAGRIVARPGGVVCCARGIVVVVVVSTTPGTVCAARVGHFQKKKYLSYFLREKSVENKCFVDG